MSGRLERVWVGSVLECDTGFWRGAGGIGSGLEFDTVAVLECDTGCLCGAGGLDQSWSLRQAQCWTAIQGCNPPKT